MDLTKTDPFYREFFLPFHLGIFALFILPWATTFTEIGPDALRQTKLLFWRTAISFEEIRGIGPHKWSGRWGYGTIIEVWSKSGSRMILQPVKAGPVLEMLRERAPGAEFGF